MKDLTARVEKSIHAGPSEVWTALTTPSELKKFFFGADIETDWKLGSPIRMRGEFNGKKYEDKGDLLEVTAERCLSFSHWSALSGQPDRREYYHVVTFDLAPDGQKTKVTLSQANLTGGVTAADVAHRAEYEKNWAGVLDGLARLFT